MTPADIMARMQYEAAAAPDVIAVGGVSTAEFEALYKQAQALYQVAKGDGRCTCVKRLNGADVWVVLKQCRRCAVIERFETSGFAEYP